MLCIQWIWNRAETFFQIKDEQFLNIVTCILCSLINERQWMGYPIKMGTQYPIWVELIQKLAFIQQLTLHTTRINLVSGKKIRSTLLKVYFSSERTIFGHYVLTWSWKRYQAFPQCNSSLWFFVCVLRLFNIYHYFARIPNGYGTNNRSIYHRRFCITEQRNKK